MGVLGTRRTAAAPPAQHEQFLTAAEVAVPSAAPGGARGGGARFAGGRGAAAGERGGGRAGSHGADACVLPPQARPPPRAPPSPSQTQPTRGCGSRVCPRRRSRRRPSARPAAPPRAASSTRWPGCRQGREGVAVVVELRWQTGGSCCKGNWPALGGAPCAPPPPAPSHSTTAHSPLQVMVAVAVIAVVAGALEDRRQVVDPLDDLSVTYTICAQLWGGEWRVLAVPARHRRPPHASLTPPTPHASARRLRHHRRPQPLRLCLLRVRRQHRRLDRPPLPPLRVGGAVCRLPSMHLARGTPGPAGHAVVRRLVHAEREGAGSWMLRPPPSPSTPRPSGSFRWTGAAITATVYGTEATSDGLKYAGWRTASW